MRLVIDNFSGKIEKLNPRALPNNVAQVATDVLIESGQLSALPSIDETETLAVFDPQTLFKYEGVHWFTFQTDVDLVLGPLSNDPYKRVYYTDDSYPKVTRNDIAVGTPPMPIASFRLGIPAPDAPTLINITGTPDPDSDYYETAYVQTFVTAWGEEGPPSNASQILTVAPGQTVNLNLGLGPVSGDYNLGSTAQRRLYRLNTSNGVAEYQLVTADGEILFPVQTYADARPSSELGMTLSSDAAGFRLGPPDDNPVLYPTGPMKGITALPGGFFAGFTGKTICFSEPYLPHYWPLSYRINTNEELVGIKAIGDGLVACTNERPYLVLGSTPASMTPVKLEVNQGCVSKRSIVNIGGMVVYASPDGLVGVSTEGARLLTEEIFTRKQWQAYQPSTIRGYYHEGRYIGFYGTGASKAGFIFDPRGGTNAFVDMTEYAGAGFNDLLDDTLYLAKSNRLYAFQGSDTLKPYTWRSKKFVTPSINFSWIQISAETYPVTVKVIADGATVFNAEISNAKERRLPGGFLAETWEIELTGTATVNHVLLTENANELI